MTLAVDVFSSRVESKPRPIAQIAYPPTMKACPKHKMPRREHRRHHLVTQCNWQDTYLVLACPGDELTGHKDKERRREELGDDQHTGSDRRFSSSDLIVLW